MKRLLCSLLCLLCTRVCWVKGQQVQQSPVSLVLQQGETAELQCSFSTGLNSMQWFYQSPGGSLVSLFYNPSGTKKSGRLTSTTVTKERRSSLHISSSQTTDSGTYFCAPLGGTTGYNLVFGTGTRLLVNPNVTDPEPAVYQLKDPQSDNITLCLFTDFDSQTNVSQSASSEAFVSGNTVMDMKAMDSKSNGAIAWSNQTSFSCKDAFKKNASHPTSDVPCDAKLVEKSFETDMNLNFQNLSVMGLRILLLKVAGFNLLMTLRLWSS
uniref:RGD1359684 protein n=2 Tax=Rattus norvegicus TaxID=10116 RepID=Q5I0I7_RAT|nr:RGD1359684 protein [Rattus norvegicus]